jgi:hypothetical protein
MEDGFLVHESDRPIRAENVNSSNVHSFRLRCKATLESEASQTCRTGVRSPARVGAKRASSKPKVDRRARAGQHTSLPCCDSEVKARDQPLFSAVASTDLASIAEPAIQGRGADGHEVGAAAAMLAAERVSGLNSAHRPLEPVKRGVGAPVRDGQGSREPRAAIAGAAIGGTHEFVCGSDAGRCAVAPGQAGAPSQSGEAGQASMAGQAAEVKSAAGAGPVAAAARASPLPGPTGLPPSFPAAEPSTCGSVVGLRGTAIEDTPGSDRCAHVHSGSAALPQPLARSEPEYGTAAGSAAGEVSPGRLCVTLGSGGGVGQCIDLDSGSDDGSSASGGEASLSAPATLAVCAGGGDGGGGGGHAASKGRSGRVGDGGEGDVGCAASAGVGGEGRAANTCGVNGACVNGACVNGSGVNGACVNGSGVNGACVNGSGVNGACVNGALSSAYDKCGTYGCVLRDRHRGLHAFALGTTCRRVHKEAVEQSHTVGMNGATAPACGEALQSSEAAPASASALAAASAASAPIRKRASSASPKPRPTKAQRLGRSPLANSPTAAPSQAARAGVGTQAPARVGPHPLASGGPQAPARAGPEPPATIKQGSCDDGPISLSANRLAAIRASWPLGTRLQCYDQYLLKWQNARVVAADGHGPGRTIKVHFEGWNAKWDEWVLLRSGRVRAWPGN